jgi:hypothetical protein
MKQALDGKRIGFLTANEGVEQSELISPWATPLDAGPRAIVSSRKPDDRDAFDHAFVEAAGRTAHESVGTAS